MEARIDVASILSWQDYGIMLYDTLIEENVIYDGLEAFREGLYIRCIRKSNEEPRFYNRYGVYVKDGYSRLALVPSKGNNDWNKFGETIFKDGDILSANLKRLGPVLYIKRGSEPETERIHYHVICVLNKNGLFDKEEGLRILDCEGAKDIRSATVGEIYTFLTYLERNGWYRNTQEYTCTFKGTPPKTFFSPFDKVLVRSGSEALWRPSLFGYKTDGNETNPYVCINGSRWEQCLPYFGNEKLLGTSDVPRVLFLNKKNETSETD